METLTEVDDVVLKVQQRAKNGTVFFHHVVEGTVDEYYHELLQEVVNDITLLPLAREFAQLMPIDDQNEVVNGFSQIIETLAIVFGKTKPEVEHDLITTLHKYPVEDVKIAQHLRHNNRLN